MNKTLSKHAVDCSEEMDELIRTEKSTYIDKITSAFKKQRTIEEQ